MKYVGRVDEEKAKARDQGDETTPGLMKVAVIPPEYRGTSLIRNALPPKITIGPWA